MRLEGPRDDILRQQRKAVHKKALPSLKKTGLCNFREQKLTGVILDDSQSFDLNRNLFDHRFTRDCEFELFLVGLEISRNSGVYVSCGFRNRRRLFRVDRNDLTRFQKIGSAVDDFSVDFDMAMDNKLFCRKDRRSKTAVLNSRLKTEFDSAHQCFVCSAFDAFCGKEDVSELTLSKRIVGFDFLLFLQHFAVGGEFFLLAVFTLLTCRIGAFHAGALGHVPDAVAEASAKFVFGLSLFHSRSFL